MTSKSTLIHRAQKALSELEALNLDEEAAPRLFQLQTTYQHLKDRSRPLSRTVRRQLAADAIAELPIHLR